MGWIADFFRLAWGFLYWNSRKTAYRLRLKRGRGRCPCQHPSDSGRAIETGCAAMIHWNDPARFRRLCPLLQQIDSGAWRCSVNRTEVRPFWSRAFAFYGASVVIVYLVATFSVFAFMRNVGYPVTYPGVLWPPAWEKFTAIRTDFFLNQYRAAAQAGDTQAALMSLSTAYNLDPQNYAAGRQLAQAWQIGQPGLSNQIYRRLLADHPSEAEATAQVWFRALLARGDFREVEKLAVKRINAAPAQSAAWLNAFLFANRRTGDASLRRHLAETPSLPPAARFLLPLADSLQGAPPGRQRTVLISAAAGAGDSLSFFHVCRELLSRGLANETLEWLERRAGLLGPRDVMPLRLDALATLGWTSTLRSEVENLLVTDPDPVVVELLSAHLIRHPDAAVRAMVFPRLDRTPLPSTPASYSAYLSLFCAAGVGEDIERLRWTAARIKAFVQADFRSLDVIGEGLLEGNRRRIENYLPALQPLPLEVTYALFEHYAPAS